ncbi:winged helix-turn-helix transcriptional regulator [Ktedonobacter racemifer]|uniref:Transcriptional regulator, HxlR family n=1 Tax=Ktedonobacter racemifer DSM 44963 TaxID=485913 RepID=D6TVT9_KTERA|nr:helix-turn-helix domain-containing protein [Ktedonobacter racemifer]EFH84322.1 transcriptional regulator, HxlR family [Ktedonobacter racemifer DSM 44963]
MREPIYTRNYQCLMEATADVIGGKWKSLIVYYLLETPRRFNELKRLLPDISQRILTQQLRELETDGIIHREIYKEIPPKVEYSLTEVGTSLQQIILPMLAWGEHYVEHFEKTRPWCKRWGLEQTGEIEHLEEEEMQR